MAARDKALELGGGALGDDPAAVQDADPVGQLVGLFEVLRGQEDRDAAGRELADDPPHHPAASRIQARRRLVEEDDPRVPDQGHRQVQAPLHPARIGRDQLSGRVREVELLEQLGDPLPTVGARQVAKVGHEPQVLLAREQVVHGRELARDADGGPDGIGLAQGVLARDAHVAGVEGDEGGEDVHGGGLARAVGAEHREDRAGRDAQVHAVEDLLLAEGFAQSGRLDCRLGSIDHRFSCFRAHQTRARSKLAEEGGPRGRRGGGPVSAIGGAADVRRSGAKVGRRTVGREAGRGGRHSSSVGRQMSRSSSAGCPAAATTISYSSAGTLSRSASRESTTSSVDSPWAKL